ncbi:hypothetical protein V501_06488 [Pseudogymnoascus sp. VKM F-4519 (FW-2642)]|nr:hypothetical protein V501_06488 [Pseudogymnoascus sp. VKM F-4519 (FW-2642)]
MDMESLFAWAFSQPRDPEFEKRYGKSRGTDAATAQQAILEAEEICTAALESGTSDAEQATSSAHPSYQCRTCDKVFECEKKRDVHQSQDHQ